MKICAESEFDVGDEAYIIKNQTTKTICSCPCGHHSHYITKNKTLPKKVNIVSVNFCESHKAGEVEFYYCISEDDVVLHTIKFYKPGLHKTMDAAQKEIDRIRIELK